MIAIFSFLETLSGEALKLQFCIPILVCLVCLYLTGNHLCRSVPAYSRSFTCETWRSIVFFA